MINIHLILFSWDQFPNEWRQKEQFEEEEEANDQKEEEEETEAEKAKEEEKKAEACHTSPHTATIAGGSTATTVPAAPGDVRGWSRG